MTKPDGSRKSVAVVQPVLLPGGGTEAVTAWTLEALKSRFNVSLLTFSEVDPDVLNHYYGTTLSDDEFSTVQPGLPPLLNRTKRFLSLKDHLMVRYCKSARSRFDLFISVGGAMDFGSPGIQYMALAPGSTLVKVLGRDPKLPAWYQVFKRVSMGIAQLMSGTSQDRLLQNTTLVTSQWAGELTQRLYGFPSYEVVYPPVNDTPAKCAWSSRKDGFLCIARISPEKQIERAVEVLKQVRQRGFEPSLHVVGRQDDPRYFERINRLCQENSSWMVLQEALPQNELGRLRGQFKYGINAAPDEPFGIALAEMVRAGCIVFVPNSGGQTEIVDDPRLTYDDIDDAVNKISQVLKNDALQDSLRNRLNNREKVFSTQVFCSNMQRIVTEFFAQE